MAGFSYYGGFYKSALYPVFRHFDTTLARWALRKYKRLARHHRRAVYWLGGIARAPVCPLASVGHTTDGWMMGPYERRHSYL